MGHLIDTLVSHRETLAAGEEGGEVGELIQELGRQKRDNETAILRFEGVQKQHREMQEKLERQVKESEDNLRKADELIVSLQDVILECTKPPEIRDAEGPDVAVFVDSGLAEVIERIKAAREMFNNRMYKSPGTAFRIISTLTEAQLRDDKLNRRLFADD